MKLFLHGFDKFILYWVPAGTRRITWIVLFVPVSLFAFSTSYLCYEITVYNLRVLASEHAYPFLSSCLRGQNVYLPLLKLRVLFICICLLLCTAYSVHLSSLYSVHLYTLRLGISVSMHVPTYKHICIHICSLLRRIIKIYPLFTQQSFVWIIEVQKLPLHNLWCLIRCRI